MSSDLTAAGFQAAGTSPTYELLWGSPANPTVQPTSKSGKSPLSKSSKSTQYCLPDDTCAGIYDLFVEKGCAAAITNNPFDDCYTLSALEELALELIPNCVLLYIYGYQVTECGVEPDTTGLESASGGTMFGVNMEDLNDLARANIPAGFP